MAELFGIIVGVLVVYYVVLGFAVAAWKKRKRKGE